MQEGTVWPGDHLLDDLQLVAFGRIPNRDRGFKDTGAGDESAHTVLVPVSHDGLDEFLEQHREQQGGNRSEEPDAYDRAQKDRRSLEQADEHRDGGRDQEKHGSLRSMGCATKRRGSCLGNRTDDESDGRGDDHGSEHGLTSELEHADLLVSRAGSAVPLPL